MKLYSDNRSILICVHLCESVAGFCAIGFRRFLSRFAGLRFFEMTGFGRYLSLSILMNLVLYIRCCALARASITFTPLCLVLYSAWQLLFSIKFNYGLPNNDFRLLTSVYELQITVYRSPITDHRSGAKFQSDIVEIGIRKNRWERLYWAILKNNIIYNDSIKLVIWCLASGKWFSIISQTSSASIPK